MDSIECKYYGFTYKCMNKSNEDISESTYAPIINMLNRKGIVSDYTYEYDRKGKLHIHGIVQFYRTPLFTTLSFYGFHQRYEELYNTERWIKYMHKDEQDIDWFKTNYAF